MKKLLVVLGILSISALGYAAVKDDYANAEKLFNENKVREGVTLLQKVSTSGDKEYAKKADLQLGMLYLQAGDITNAKKYTNQVLKNVNLTKDEKLATAEILYEIAKAENNIAEQEKQLKYLETETQGKNPYYASNYVIMYLNSNREDKAMEKYNSVISSSDNEFKSRVNFNIGINYAGMNKFKEAKKYLNESYNQTMEGMLNSGMALVEIAVTENNLAEAERILLDMNAKTGDKELELFDVIGKFYYNYKDYDKAITYFKKITDKEPNAVEQKLILLAIYENKKDTTNITKTYTDLKSLIKENVNRNLGVLLFNINETASAEKYLKKAISEDKNNEAKLLLGQVYASTGRKAEAITILKEAVASKVEGASAVLAEVEKMK